MDIVLTFYKEVKTDGRVPKITTVTTQLRIQRSSAFRESATIDRNRKTVFVGCEYGGRDIDISDIGEWDTLTVGIDDEEEDEDGA